MGIRVKLEEKEREVMKCKNNGITKTLEENKCDSFYNFGVGGNLSMIHI